MRALTLFEISIHQEMSLAEPSRSLAAMSVFLLKACWQALRLWAQPPLFPPLSAWHYLLSLY
jgi:hypothetical protein